MRTLLFYLKCLNKNADIYFQCVLGLIGSARKQIHCCILLHLENMIPALLFLKTKSVSTWNRIIKGSVRKI